MKYSLIVLYNNYNGIDTVDYAPVSSALLAGGVFLDEIVILPYNSPSAVSAALLRLSAECDAVIIACDRALHNYAREAAAEAAAKPFTDEYLLETERCLYAVLPLGARGAELAREEVVPRIDARRGKRFSRVVVRYVAAPGERVREVLKEAAAASGGKLSLHAGEKYGCGRIEVIYDSETPKMIMDDVVRILASSLAEWTYALEDVTIEQRLFEVLKLHRLRISTAESFTAGGVGQAIVSNPGASEVFFEGLNTYDNKSKQERLNVSEFTLRNKGAVSDETAYEMAAGLIAQGNCDISIATTGIAGPDADGTDKPVGLCFLAIGTKERVRVFRYRLAGDRETVTKTAINLALFHAYQEIK